MHFIEPVWAVEKDLKANSTAFLTAACTRSFAHRTKKGSREVVNNGRLRKPTNRDKGSTEKELRTGTAS